MSQGESPVTIVIIKKKLGWLFLEECDVCGGDEPGDDDGVYGESGLCVGSSRASLLHNVQLACLLLVAISREASAPSPVRYSYLGT
jgi:hypothetical protein